MWSANSKQINYAVSPEIGMVGLRDLFGTTISDLPALGVGVGVFPLTTASPLNLAVDNQEINTVGRTKNGGIHQFWQNVSQLQSQHQTNIVHSSGVQNDGLMIDGSGSSSSCQDCGNQAKKGCSHRRCRTCCRSHGFDCSTHVKSTWISATRRREKHLPTQAMAATGSSVSTYNSGLIKKPKLAICSQNTTNSLTSTSNTTPPGSFDTSSTHQDAANYKEPMPGQVRAPAVFKCVRVTAVADGDDVYAYQAVAKIGGRVFKGFLYDQGPVESKDYGLPNLSELNLGGKRNDTCSSSPVIDPSDVYAASGGGMLGGLSYGDQIN